MDVEQRVERVEEAILIMKDLTVRFDQRIDGFREENQTFRHEVREALTNFRVELRDSRSEFDAKMGLLTDAQTRNEVAIAELRESSRELRLASEAQLIRIERLEQA